MTIKNIVTIVLLRLIAICAQPAEARFGWYPDFDELTRKSDVILIATDTNMQELKERWIVPNMAPETELIGLETTFNIVAVLKGDLKESSFVLHHYRIPVTTVRETLSNDLGLMTFFGDEQRYLMFLNKEADGRYSPASGQIDPIYSIRPIADTGLNFGDPFVPFLSRVLFWFFLAVVFPIVSLICSLIFLKNARKRKP